MKFVCEFNGCKHEYIFPQAASTPYVPDEIKINIDNEGNVTENIMMPDTVNYFYTGNLLFNLF